MILGLEANSYYNNILYETAGDFKHIQYHFNIGMHCGICNPDLFRPSSALYPTDIGMYSGFDACLRTILYAYEYLCRRICNLYKP